MHKKETNLKHSKLANDLLNYINENIDTDINLDELSVNLNISKHHLHKIFKEQMGANIYEVIKSTRLQKASNLLITNKYSTITEVANLCGYSSQTSFIRAFKQRFEQTPKEWRKGGYKEYSNKILSTSQVTRLSNTDFSHLEAKIVRTPKRKVYYIRQNGYNKNSFSLWQKMIAWVYTNEIESYEQIGIYHDNPVITPLENCHYVACIEPLDKIDLVNTSLPTFDIPDVICARFEIEGKYGDILKLIQWVYHVWLPDSGFETTTVPSYTIFKKNHFLSDDKLFSGEYYLPIRYV
jgi:AraC family transcriptional regulator